MPKGSNASRFDNAAVEQINGRGRRGRLLSYHVALLRFTCVVSVSPHFISIVKLKGFVREMSVRGCPGQFFFAKSAEVLYICSVNSFLIVAILNEANYELYKNRSIFIDIVL